MANFFKKNTTDSENDLRERILNAKPPPPTIDIRDIFTWKQQVLPERTRQRSPQRPTQREMPASGWLTETEVSQIIGCSLSLLRQNRHRRVGLPYIKMGKSVRYAAKDITKYMEERRIIPD